MFALSKHRSNWQYMYDRSWILNVHPKVLWVKRTISFTFHLVHFAIHWFSIRINPYMPDYRQNKAVSTVCHVWISYYRKYICLANTLATFIHSYNLWIWHSFGRMGAKRVCLDLLKEINRKGFLKAFRNSSRTTGSFFFIYIVRNASFYSQSRNCRVWNRSRWQNIGENYRKTFLLTFYWKP